VAKALVLLHLALVLALAAGALGIWRLRCENFGCMGLGVAWFAWAVAFVAVLGVAALARWKAAAAGLGAVAKAVLLLHMLMGASLLVVWAVKGLA
jgi:hypothetical protein